MVVFLLCIAAGVFLSLIFSSLFGKNSIDAEQKAAFAERTVVEYDQRIEKLRLDLLAAMHIEAGYPITFAHLIEKALAELDGYHRLLAMAHGVIGGAGVRSIQIAGRRWALVPMRDAVTGSFTGAAKPRSKPDNKAKSLTRKR